MPDQPLGNRRIRYDQGSSPRLKKQSISLSETTAMPGRNARAVLRYYQSGELSSSRAARLIVADKLLRLSTYGPSGL